MSDPTNSQPQTPRKKKRHHGRLSGSLLSIALVRLRNDGEATFHSPQDVIYDQVGKGKDGFVHLEEAISLYPTVAEIPRHLLPPPEVLEKVKSTQGEIVRCPFCPSTFSGIVVKRSFKRHLQRHWNHAAAEKVKEIDDQQSSIAPSPSLISPISHPLLGATKPGNTQGHTTSDTGARESSHAVPASISTPKAPTNKKGQKPLVTPTLSVRKGIATLAVARAMEVLRAKAGMVFNSPDACPNLEHQVFTQREEQFLDVDATFSLYPTIDQLPQGFWPTALQYTLAATAAAEHRVRCLFCSWSFTGAYVKANFRGHVRYHWKLAAAEQKADPSTPADVRLSPAIAPSLCGPSASPLVPKVRITRTHVPQPDGAGSSKADIVQPSLSLKIRCTRAGQIATSAGLATDREAWRPQERKRSYTEAFSEEDTNRRESSHAIDGEEYAKPGQHTGIARALSSIRMKPDTSFIPPEQPMSYEALVLMVGRYFDIDKTVSLYPLVDQLPDRFWPSDETFRKVAAKEGLERVRCPFCTSSFKGGAARKNMRVHLQRHWWHSSGRSGVETPNGVLTANIESFDATSTRSSLDFTPIPPHPSVSPKVRAKTNPKRTQPTIAQTNTDLEVNRANYGTRPQAKESTISGLMPSGVQ